MPPVDPIDYYKLCQTGIMNLLRGLSYFSTRPLIQVTDNRNNINRGFDYWAVFLPSTFTRSKAGPKDITYAWITIFDLYVRYVTAEEAPSKFMEVRSAIINLLDVYPTLNGVLGVRDVSILARSEMLQDTPGDNPNFIIQTLAVTTIQRIARIF